MTVQEQIDAGFVKVDQYDWPEDFAHENGQYECWCAACGVKFLGHKRRVTCKVCSTHSKGIQQPPDPTKAGQL